MKEINLLFKSYSRDKIIYIDYRKLNNGPHIVVAFKNGYGASIISNEYSYGGKDGLIEVALIEFNRFDATLKDYILRYDKNRFKDDQVIGWLNEEELDDILGYISRKKALIGFKK